METLGSAVRKKESPIIWGFEDSATELQFLLGSRWQTAVFGQAKIISYLHNQKGSIKLGIIFLIDGLKIGFVGVSERGILDFRCLSLVPE